MMHALSSGVMTTPPFPILEVCDVCQHRQAIVTLGCVDYCALCAPAPKRSDPDIERARDLHPSSWPTELEAVGR